MSSLFNSFLCVTCPLYIAGLEQNEKTAFFSFLPSVTIGSPIVQIYSQVADLGSACKLAPQSPRLPQTETLTMTVLKSILKLSEVSSLSVGTIYSFHKRSSDQTHVNKHKQT